MDTSASYENLCLFDCETVIIEIGSLFMHR